MGGSISKKRPKSKSSKLTNVFVGQGLQQSPAALNGGDCHQEDRTVSNSISQLGTLNTQSSQGVDNSSLLLDTRGNLAKYSPKSRVTSNASDEEFLQFPNPPPPYSEVDPLASTSGFSAGTRGFVGIPNLMDIDPDDVGEALQLSDRYRTPFRGPSPRDHWSKEDTSDSQTADYDSKASPGSRSKSLSRYGLASSNPNLVQELEGQVKSKKNRKWNERRNEKTNFQEPPGMTKKKEFRSNPNVFASNSEFSVPGKHNRFQDGKQKRSGNFNGNANGRGNRTRLITPEQLADLSRKSDQEILFRIQTFSTGFMSLLAETEYSDEVLVLVMDILGKVCRNDDCPHTANAILQTALYTKLFNVRMVTYLQTAPYDGSMDENTTLLQNLLVVFTTVLREFKKEAEQKLGDCLTLGRRAINQLIDPSGDLDDELIQELRNLTDVQRVNTWATSETLTSGFPAVFNVNYEPQPGIEPKTSAEYKNQLLVLLQKAFVDTLRTTHGTPQSVLYRNVHVIDTDCTCKEGLVHKLSFETDGHEASWNDTTKLLEGSTVFLSRNLQKEMHCAVVVRRHLEELSLGHVWVKMLDWQSTILQCGKPLEMVENFTYKDDFVSLMEALHLQLEYPLPFTNHILGMKKNVSHPKYLDSKSFFSFPPSVPSKGKEVKKKFSALNPNTWPSGQSFGLDGPFQEAFKHVLTKELALVHSSSGTEAIMFGAGVLKAFLWNEELWHSSQAPITVIFNSDEALDEFVKAVLTLSPNEKIIRMGGHCQDTLLRNYELDERRCIVCNTKDFPTYVMQNKRILHDKMRKLKSDIAFKMGLLEKGRTRLLKNEALKNHITKNHARQLQSLNLNSDEDPLLQWLSFYTIQDLQCLQREQQTMSNEPSKKGGRKSGTKSRSPGRSDDNFGSVLSHIEMNRRSTAFPTEEFDDAEEKSSMLNADDPFISQDQIREDLLHLKGKQFCLSDIIKLELERKDVMRDAEVDDVLLLEPRDRWRLYRNWLSKFESCIRNELSKLQKKYEKSFLQMQEVVREIDVSILRRATVVGVTVASAAKHHRLFKMVAPRIIIVEQAGQIAEPNLVASLTEQCWHLILIGDHSQLRPAINGFRSSDSANRPRTISLFEKLISKGVRYVSLSDTHSMSSSVHNVLKCLFPAMPCVPINALAPENSSIRGIASDIYFINNSCPESMTGTSPCCYTNEYEANFLVLLSKYLVHQGYSQAQITILATGIGQVQLLSMLSKQNSLNQITCASVEDYQGKSNDIVLLSLVRSNDHGDVGPMADDNYMSVALTRARLGLYCIGNFKMLVDSLVSWKAHITFLVGQQLYGSTLTLKCYWHPMQTYEANSCDALKVAVSGICEQPCLASLECGHKCMKKCHGDDREHKSTQCGHPCGKVVCPAGHKCIKRCFEKCPPCQMSFKKVQSCGHATVVKCSQLQQRIQCTEKCKKTLPCGHPCPKQCGEKCDLTACTFINEYHESPCKHVFFISCAQMRMTGVEKLCPMPCTEKLPCGHKCTGTCGQCQQGRMHIACKEKCESVLICGHRCQEPCGSNCLPCKDSCNRRCDHAQCPSVCGSPCVPCLEPCGWQCPHRKCSKMCFEKCDRAACNMQCPRVLPCKHPCIGFCGEPCPPLCRICDRAQILQGMPGSNQIGTARFVLLEDCHHVVEVIRLNKIMQGNGTVDVKMCPMPRCGTPIRKCVRYGNMIKQTLFDVTKIIKQCNESESGLNMPLEGLRMAIKALPESTLTQAVRQLKAEALQSLSCQQASVLENKYSFLVCMQGLWKTAHRIASGQDGIERVNFLSRYLEEALMGLSTASNQMAIDAFVMELKRAMYLVHVVQSLQNHPLMNVNGRSLCVNLSNYLVDTKPFSAAAEAVAVRQIQRLHLFCKIPSVHLEDTAKVSVSDLQQFTAGHWAKCSHGHFSFSRRLIEGQEIQCKICASKHGK